MGAKTIHLSADDITYLLLPGAQGEISREGVAIDDTIFGQTYKSALTGPITWGITANAIYKGYAGYVAKLLKPGTSTLMTTEAMSLVSGKTYRVTATAKRCFDRANATFNVFDGGVNKNAELDNVNYVFGEVTFKSSYTVTGAVTVTTNYFPLISLGKYTGYTLNMTADPIRDSDMPALQANLGYHTHTPGLKTVSIELPTVFNATDDWPNLLDDRSEYVIEINPDGTAFSGSIGRGFFRLISQRQSGNVGALEEESLRFDLNVPYYPAQPTLTYPFGWFHAPATPIPAAIKTALDRFLADLPVYARYLHDGVAGWKGSGVLTSLSLTAGMESTNTFAVNVQMSGAPTVV
jgi:hypothetical protein